LAILAPLAPVGLQTNAALAIGEAFTTKVGNPKRSLHHKLASAAKASPRDWHLRRSLRRVIGICGEAFAARLAR